VAWTGVTGKPTTVEGYGITDAVVIDGNYVHTDNNYTALEKTKLSGIAAGADVSTITSVKVNGVALTPSSKAVDITVPTDNASLANGAGYQTASQVSSAVSTGTAGKADKSTSLSGYGIADAYTKNEIDAKITSTYKAAGSTAFASLPTPASSNVGFVYNLTDAFTTTASFVEGAGKNYPVGTNVVIVDVGSGTYKYDVMAGFVDLSAYAKTADITAITNSEIDTVVAS